jgi:hypothetical protein
MPHLHARHAAATPVPVSLLRLSAGTRLLGAGLAIAAIWLAVFWAWS